jgi:hypothetical protein
MIIRSVVASAVFSELPHPVVSTYVLGSVGSRR